MNYTIYQSYVKEPLKFFAPSNPPRRSNTFGIQSKKAKKTQNFAAPAQFFMLPPGQSQNHGFFREKVDSAITKPETIKLKKVEIVFDEVSLTSGSNTSRNYDQNTKSFRPVTVNPRFFRKNSMEYEGHKNFI